MLITALLFFCLFIVSLVGLNFPTKKFTSWFELNKPSSQNTTPISHANTTSRKLGKTRICRDTRDISELKTVFNTFDTNRDGHITCYELRESLKRIGLEMSEGEVRDMVKRVDSNGDGLVDFDEFCELYELVVRGEREGDEGEGEERDEREMKEAFDVFDGNKDGVITVEELGLVLGSLGIKEGMRVENCKEMIKKVDVDGDGMVSFDEFKRMMKFGGRLLDIS